MKNIITILAISSLFMSASSFACSKHQAKHQHSQAKTSQAHSVK